MIAGDNSMTAEFELVGGRYSGVPVDVSVKVKFQQLKSGQYASPLDPYELELSLTNKPNGVGLGVGGPKRYVDIGDERIKGNQFM